MKRFASTQLPLPVDREPTTNERLRAADFTKSPAGLYRWNYYGGGMLLFTGDVHACNEWLDALETRALLGCRTREAAKVRAGRKRALRAAWQPIPAELLHPDQGGECRCLCAYCARQRPTAS